MLVQAVDQKRIGVSGIPCQAVKLGDNQNPFNPANVLDGSL
jgi:hypothetical protein